MLDTKMEKSWAGKVCKNSPSCQITDFAWRTICHLDIFMYFSYYHVLHLQTLCVILNEPNNSEMIVKF